MKVPKNLYFYDVIIEPSLSGKSTLSSIFYDSCKGLKCYEVEANRTTFILDFIECDPTYILGKCSTKEDFRPTKLVQERDLISNKTYRVPPFVDKQLENFSYFYISLNQQNTGELLEIHNIKVPRIDEVLMNFVIKISSGANLISISRRRIKNLEGRFKEYRTALTGFELKFTDEFDDEGPITGLREVLGNAFRPTAYRMDVKICEAKDDFMTNLLALIKRKGISEPKLKVKNEFGCEDVISLIENYLTKNIPIELEDDSVFDIERIKSIFVEEVKKL